MYSRTTDLHHTKKGMATLVACIVQTLNEFDPSFQDRFLARLAGTFESLRDSEIASIHELEMLTRGQARLSSAG
jgi:hypothetical protein